MSLDIFSIHFYEYSDKGIKNCLGEDFEVFVLKILKKNEKGRGNMVHNKWYP